MPDTKRIWLSDNWAGRSAELLMEYGPWLPLTVTMDHQQRWVRVLGLLWFLVWGLPAVALLGLPIVALLLADIIVMTWRGEL